MFKKKATSVHNFHHEVSKRSKEAKLNRSPEREKIDELEEQLKASRKMWREQLKKLKEAQKEITYLKSQVKNLKADNENLKDDLKTLQDRGHV